MFLIERGLALDNTKQTDFPLPVYPTNPLIIPTTTKTNTKTTASTIKYSVETVPSSLISP